MKTLFIEKHIFKQKEKDLGKGPWIDEPDEISFEHADMECLIKRICKFIFNPRVVFGGHLAGYVLIPESHPICGCNDVDDYEFNVHGGVTFCAYYPITGNFQIGFDCAHGFDLIPSNDLISKEDPLGLGDSFLESDDIYRDIPYVIEQCKHLAEQISNAASKIGL